jgi:hypothetical protein
LPWRRWRWLRRWCGSRLWRGGFLGISRPLMHSSNLWRSIFRSPLRRRNRIILLGALLEQMANRTGELLHLLRLLEEIHFVISLANLIRNTTSPRLDLVELMLLLVVSSLADVDILVGRESSRSTFVVSSNEHDKASIDNLINSMVSILTSFDDFVFQEMTVKSMDGLLGSVVPAGIDPFGAILILPRPENLSHDRFGQIIRVLNVDPVACIRVSLNMSIERKVRKY